MNQPLHQSANQPIEAPEAVQAKYKQSTFFSHPHTLHHLEGADVLGEELLPPLSVRSLDVNLGKRHKTKDSDNKIKTKA